jgi:hypothetical protein
MSLIDCFKVALGALRLNALRSFLAMLGVIIGVASVIVMVSVATGAGQAIEARIKALGTNLLVISPGSFTSGGRRAGEGTALPLSEQDLEAIRARLPEVSAVAGVVSGSAPVIYGDANWTTSVDGVNEDYLEVRDWPLSEGRNFTATELRSAAKVAILGATVVRELLGNVPPVGQQIRVMNVPFTIIGVLSVKGQSGYGTDQDDTVVVPVTTARRRLFGADKTVTDNLRSIMVEVASAEAMSDAQSEIETLLRERRRVRADAPNDFQVRNMAEFIRTRSETQSIEHSARRDRRDLTRRRRHRHHEHHARFGDGTHKGNRASDGGGCAAERYTASVSHRGDDALPHGRADRSDDWRRGGRRDVDLGCVADRARTIACGPRNAVSGARGRIFRLLSGPTRLVAQSHRRAQI